MLYLCLVWQSYWSGYVVRRIADLFEQGIGPGWPWVLPFIFAVPLSLVLQPLAILVFFIAARFAQLVLIKGMVEAECLAIAFYIAVFVILFGVCWLVLLSCWFGGLLPWPWPSESLGTS